jgi:hypothetical protein
VRISLTAAAVVLALACPAGSPAVGSAATAAIYVNYDINCTFTLTVDPGTVIASTSPPGQTLLPGTYQLLTTMENYASGYVCGAPRFTLTGPGVSVSIPFPGEELHDARVISLQPASTYVAQDVTAPDATRRVFSTAATGSSSSLASSTPGSSGTQHGSTQSDLVGSAIAVYRGKLVATVSAAGKPRLELNGRRVGSLKAGRYNVTVDDTDTRAGLFLMRSGGRAVTISGTAFVGHRTVPITLAAGAWTYFSKRGAATRFTVVGG